MLKPEEVELQAKRKEDENFAFRTFLKINADEQKLDKQFLKLHKELFKDYDCSKCRNCCTKYAGTIPEEDLRKDAAKLGRSVKGFIKQYLKPEMDFDGNYSTLHVPCDFLSEDGSCILEDCKPESCKKYPYTDQPERLQSMLSVLDVVIVCPVAFEILEQLKEEYGYRYRRKR
ncbi:MAG: YkgJ family cysteine cluster protein [Lachnospiraceae bacterium]|nr:YkgJ family cysteine cluster protein [Lachnospiraceae bacterium]